ncbi:MAG: hypothetical protein OXQ99_11900 [Chloroflexota bacterium]|nr:hypothetical protein [Chloroflexota bacterium]
MVALLLTWVAPLWGSIPQSLAQMLAAIESDVRRLRELAEKSPATVEFISQQEANQRFEQSYAEDSDQERVAQAHLFYWALDLIERDADLQALSLANDQGSILGYYNSESKTMTLIQPEKTAPHRLTYPQKLIYAHEYAHALQDQYFDLDALRERYRDSTNFDLHLSLTALIEGDAEFIKLDYALEQWSKNQAAFERDMEAAENADNSHAEPLDLPTIFDAISHFLYVVGREFVTKLWIEDGWPGVNRAFRNRPPTTSEQIYHPMRYLAREEAIVIEAPLLNAQINDGWRLAYYDAVGEFFLRQHLMTHLSESAAARLADGWGGDRMLIFSDADNKMIRWVWYQAWDDANETKQFASNYPRFLDRRYEKGSEDGRCWVGETAHCFARISETETRISMAANRVTALAMLAFDAGAASSPPLTP